VRVLLVEDSATDAKLLVQELKRGGREIEFERVEDDAGMRAALERKTWDVILSDWSMPKFSGVAALSLARQLCPEVPLIIVSGTIGEDVAVEAMRAGARDFVLKDRIARLLPVLERELAERKALTAATAALGQSERKLLKAEARYRALVEKSTDVISLTDSSSVVTYVSPAIERILGYTPEEYTGQPSLARVHEQELPLAEHVMAQVSTTPGKTMQIELRVRHKDGSFRWLESSVTNHLDDPLVGGLVGNSRDVTDRKNAELALLRTEMQLRQAQKMEAIGNFAGGVAHDFNNLLSVMLSYSQMMAEDLTPSDPRKADLDEIIEAGRRAADLTRQLLAFGRVQILQPRVLNLNDVIIGIEKMLQRLIGENVLLTVIASPDLGRTKVDPGQIEQIVMNLAVNSRDAMPDGGKLTIETANVCLDETYVSEHVGARVGEHVMLAVTDTGTGMDAATQARMYEPFFTTKERGRGTGLGLATVFGIVQQSGGNVWVYSELGKGTTFKVYFPRTDEPNTTVADSLSPARDLHGTETILLVEDEEAVRVLARTILRRLGYHVLEAQSGGDALLICEQHTAEIHLMLTDVVMPRMSGRQLADRLQPLRPKMKVLFMSGYTDNSIIHHGVLDSGVMFIQKPITPDSLGRKVKETLEQKA
jgi:two-component system, cell cycle sensor histidine kinase and response regulator CckA